MEAACGAVLLRKDGPDWTAPSAQQDSAFHKLLNQGVLFADGHLALGFLAAGCVQPDPEWANKAALAIGAVSPDAGAMRERQTSVFKVADEERLLVEATQVLQDLGFTIEESAPRYGVLAGS